MSTAMTAPPVLEIETDQCFVLRGMSWEKYVAINDVVGDRQNLRVIYCDGELTLSSSLWRKS
jgi:hypothetical protein